MFRFAFCVLFAVVTVGQGFAQEMVCENGQCRLVPRLANATRNFAAQLNQSRGLYHDTSYVGPEVVFKSSGVATEEMAIEAWQNSPPHARLLPSITDIQCVGNSCVGRGQVATAVARTATAPVRMVQEKRLRKALRNVFVR